MRGGIFDIFKSDNQDNSGKEESSILDKPKDSIGMGSNGPLSSEKIAKEQQALKTKYEQDMKELETKKQQTIASTENEKNELIKKLNEEAAIKKQEFTQKQTELTNELKQIKDRAQRELSHVAQTPTPAPAHVGGNGKKGSASKTRKGRKDFITHKGDKYYNADGHRQSKAHKPYEVNGGQSKVL